MRAFAIARPLTVLALVLASLGLRPALANELRISNLVASTGAFQAFQAFQAAQSGKPTTDHPQQAQPAPVPGTDQPQPLSLQDVIARDVLEPLQTGLTTHDLKQIWSVFDPQVTFNFAEVRDQFRALLNNSSGLLFRYKLLQLTADKDHASAICEVDLDATPVDDTLIAVRRSTQMRFQLKHTAGGWKIAAFTPGDFFAQ